MQALRRIRPVQGDRITAIGQLSPYRAEDRHVIRDAKPLGQACSLVRRLRRVELDQHHVAAGRQLEAARKLERRAAVDPPCVFRVQRVVQRYGHGGDVSQLDELVVRRAGAERQRGGVVMHLVDHHRPDLCRGIGRAVAVAKGRERGWRVHAERRLGQGGELIAEAGFHPAKRHAVFRRVELNDRAAASQVAERVRLGKDDRVAVGGVERKTPIGPRYRVELRLVKRRQPARRQDRVRRDPELFQV